MTVDMSPDQFMQAVPTLPNGNTAWAQRYGTELREIIVRQAHRQPRSVQRHLGPSELGHECLSGDTEVVTRTGLRRIADLAAEGSAELLVPMLYSGSDVRKRWGKFQRVPVTCFGERELFKVTLRRGLDVKIVHTTAGHAWFRSYWSGKRRKQERLTTTALKPGHKLTQLRRAMSTTATLMPVAVAQGFTFGDGTKGSDDGKYRAAVLNLYHNGKDEALLPFFPGEHDQYTDPRCAYTCTYIRNLPRFWKELPPASESCGFLLSWLAGYFAADGCVTEDGHCTISSANREHLEFVRGIAAICGIGYGQIQCHMRRGITGKQLQPEATALYKLSLRRRDFPAWFFLIEEHLRRVKAANQTAEHDPHWVVVSIEPTGRTEPVYCATVDGIGAFALADDLMTGNCDRLIVGKLAGEAVTNHVVSPWPSVVGTAVHAWLADKFALENTLTGTLRWVPEQKVSPHPSYPGTADLYDAAEQAVCDWKILAESSMRKVKSPSGPPRHYQVQLLLYALGYRKLGLPVRRVALVALPRTAATLDGMYVWAHDCSPADDELLNQVLAITETRRQVAQEILAGRLDIRQVPITPGPDICYFCFAGETEVVTRDGIRPIAELAGTTPELLVPRQGKNPGLQAQGDFVRAPVRMLGTQRLWKIELGSRRAVKTVYATAEHRWLLTARESRANPGNKHGHLIQGRQRPSSQFERTTQQLQPGDRLRSLRAMRAALPMMPWAVAQGFVFGDGTRGQGSRPASLKIYDNGKDEALLPFFPFTEPNQHADGKHITGLPRFWKDLPPIRESRTFLLSWLAGYFAADGNVTEAGQCVLDSADEQAIRFARDVAAVCGVGYSPIRSKWRLGRGQEPTELWSIGLRRRDLPDWFFLIKEHAIRAARANDDDARGTYWTVKSVQVTDRIEPVYCATVDGAEMFGLADDLLTGNCPFYRPQSATDGGPGCPGHSLPG